MRSCRAWYIGTDARTESQGRVLRPGSQLSLCLRRPASCRLTWPPLPAWSTPPTKAASPALGTRAPGSRCSTIWRGGPRSPPPWASTPPAPGWEPLGQPRPRPAGQPWTPLRPRCLLAPLRCPELRCLVSPPCFLPPNPPPRLAGCASCSSAWLEHAWSGPIKRQWSAQGCLVLQQLAANSVDGQYVGGGPPASPSAGAGPAAHACGSVCDGAQGAGAAGLVSAVREVAWSCLMSWPAGSVADVGILYMQASMTPPDACWNLLNAHRPST